MCIRDRVSLAYQVRTEDGVLVDESPVSAPLDYLHGHGSLISGPVSYTHLSFASKQASILPPSE